MKPSASTSDMISALSKLFHGTTSLIVVPPSILSPYFSKSVRDAAGSKRRARASPVRATNARGTHSSSE